MYRAKKINSNLWIYGSLIGKKYIYDESKPHLKKLEEIDPKTICKFSGLRDKNKVELYERDILCAIGDDSSIITIQCPEVKELNTWVKIKKLLSVNNTAQKIGDLLDKQTYKGVMNYE